MVGLEEQKGYYSWGSCSLRSYEITCNELESLKWDATSHTKKMITKLHIAVEGRRICLKEGTKMGI